MDKLLPLISYDYAHVFLSPEKGLLIDNWKEIFRDGKVSSNGTLELVVGGDHFLQIQGVSIPFSSLGLMSKPEDVIGVAKKLIGNCENGLARYSELVKQKVFQDNLYFTPAGLSDYSHGFHSPKGDKVGDWIKYANSIKGDLKGYFPEGFSLPRGFQIKFVPTFQALRDMDNFLTKGSTDIHTFTGDTFGERIDRFLQAYDAAKTHEEWIETEERRMRRVARERVGGFYLGETGKAKFAEIVLEKKENIPIVN